MSTLSLRPVNCPDSWSGCEGGAVKNRQTMGIMATVPERRASLIAQLKKNLPAMQETPVWFLVQEDPPEKGSVQFSCSVVSDSLQSHGLQHARLPCSSPTREVCSGIGLSYPLQYSWASLVAQKVKNLPAMWKTWVRSLGWKLSWRRAWQTTPVFLPQESLWTEEPGGVQSMWLQRVRHNWTTNKHSIQYTREKNCHSNPEIISPKTDGFALAVLQ